MGSQFRLAAAVTWPSLGWKEEECGSPQGTQLSTAASPWHSGQGAAAFQRAQGRVAGAAGCTGTRGRLPGTAGSWALSLGAVGQRQRCVPGSLPSWCHHLSSFSSPSLPCFGFSLVQHPAAAFSAQPGDVGCLQLYERGLCPVSWPWIRSPDVKDQEFLLLQAALHNSVRVSLPTACGGEPAQGALAQQFAPIPPQRGQWWGWDRAGEQT